MSENFENFVKKFKVDDLLIYESDCWRWSIRPLQCTIGAGILSLKRPAETMKELTENEGADLIKIVSVIENTLLHCFGQEIMNYIMLMMVDKHIHYHIVPRYSKEILFGEKLFKDAYWPKPPVLDTGKLDENELLLIRDYLRENLVV
ncbi:MAG: hypothetical protein IJF88_06925 [Oscillospiraceae bacterium]|nr:hypothetical protein [Oscillospiraceae bacterium]